jgi:hypothetical protein
MRAEGNMSENDDVIELRNRHRLWSLYPTSEEREFDAIVGAHEA